MRVRRFVLCAKLMADADASCVALTWFKDQFIKCHDRAALVKTWLPAQYTGPPTFLDQLVYDRALSLVSPNVLTLTTQGDFTDDYDRVVQLRGRSYSTKHRRQKSASCCMRSPSGACTPCATIYCTPTTRSSKKTAARSLHVRLHPLHL